MHGDAGDTGAGLLALLFANGLIAPVYQGVRSAVLPECCRRPPLRPGPLADADGGQGAQVVGYGAGGLLLAIFSPRGALAAERCLRGIGAGAALRHRPAGRTRHGAGSMARDSLAGLRGALAHRPTRRILLFSWLVPACAVAPEALAAPYAAHIGQPARAAGFLLIGIPLGTIAADVVAARLLSSRLQRRSSSRRRS